MERPKPFTQIKNGRVIVATPGTAIQFSADTSCKKVIITAETNNTNPVTVGDKNVVGALTTRIGHPLAAGASVTLEVENLNMLWLDAVTATEGVTFLALN